MRIQEIVSKIIPFRGNKKSRLRILLYTDSRGENIPGYTRYRHYSHKLQDHYHVDSYLCPEKWTTTLDFLKFYESMPDERYELIILHTGVVDFSPRHQSIMKEVIYPQKADIFNDVFGEENIVSYLESDLNCEYEGDKTINMYSIDMAERYLLPRLNTIPNLIWISCNRIVPNWRGNYFKERPRNINLVERYSDLFSSSLDNVVDLMDWSIDEVKKHTFDNIHPNKKGSDYIYLKLMDKIHFFNEK